MGEQAHSPPTMIHPPLHALKCAREKRLTGCLPFPGSAGRTAEKSLRGEKGRQRIQRPTLVVWWIASWRALSVDQRHHST